MVHIRENRKLRFETSGVNVKPTWRIFCELIHQVNHIMSKSNQLKFI